ncbi:hypothetical protein EJ06DRAFT_387208 [Trichodelitschia bisporula]|uniref:DNA replication regulator Sld3 C-terminal domain-containing protein n=1 Tax=Trichodelitschia bisporula TaxID=703511 RepID=A0A6G1HZ85_9PEZI|nr:hypothetical protein EJ06DRAFT_387208 [Trichodelitschia bisporula]
MSGPSFLSVSSLPAIPSSEPLPAVASPDDTRKRRRSEFELVPLQPNSIIIQPCPNSNSNKATVLKPLRVIDRYQLALNFLEPANASLLPTARLFTAFIDSLECDTNEAKDTPLLVARSELEKTLYIVELVRSGTYALCRLASWVELRHFDHGKPTRSLLLASIPDLEADLSSTWWAKAVISGTQSLAPQPVVKRPRLALQRPDTVEIPVPEPGGFEPQNERPLREFSDATEDKSPEEVSSTLVQQYLEALYVSRTTLAFFAKGPLARARTALNANASNPKGLVSLAQCLRTMLLTLNSMDKKYREKLPAIVRTILPWASDEELKKPYKRKKAKMPKLGRDGVYSFEDGFVRKWWASDGSIKQDDWPGSSGEQLIRRRISALRVRETLAQIVLVLEIFALEATPGFGTAQLQGPEDEGLDPGPKKKRKQKKPQDLMLLLDMLLDKLCIWQSIEQDGDLGISGESTQAGEMNKLIDRDLLSSFCVEVIIPFYQSRIPEHARLVNKKFGGPGGVSPQKMAKTKPAKPPKPTRQESKESASKETASHKPRRQLQKTASASINSTQLRHPSLARSMTEMSLPRLKREASEISLRDIPRLENQALTRRDSETQLKHLSRRQVDLGPKSAVNDKKRRQDVSIQEKLRDAISTLKKPNRGAAVRDYVDAVESRTLAGGPAKKKTALSAFKGPRDIQVEATPKKNKASQSAFHLALHGTGIPATPSRNSSDFFVPRSSHRSNDFSLDRHSASSRGAAEVIAPTPAHGSTKGPLFPQLTRSSIPEGPPTTLDFPAIGSVAAQSNNSIQQMQSPSRPAVRATPLKQTSNSAPDVIFATPVKPLNFASPELPKTSRLVPATPTLPEGKSIYDALGWNDDYDI